MLNLVYNLAALKEFELIKKTALYLSEYFRFVLRSGDKAIPLREELRHIETYMGLQQIRFPGMIDYEADIGPGLDALEILPLTLQPFVENSVIHGFTRERAFRVSVRARREGDATAIEISDNGAGMDEGTRGCLNAYLRDGKRVAAGEDSGGAHIGIKNVAMRLWERYGDGAKLEFLAQEGPGTRVRVVLARAMGVEAGGIL